MFFVFKRRLPAGILFDCENSLWHWEIWPVGGGSPARLGPASRLVPADPVWFTRHLEIESATHLAGRRAFRRFTDFWCGCGGRSEIHSLLRSTAAVVARGRAFSYRGYSPLWPPRLPSRSPTATASARKSWTPRSRFWRRPARLSTSRRSKSARRFICAATRPASNPAPGSRCCGPRCF